jgi:hypothetical protein
MRGEKIGKMDDNEGNKRKGKKKERKEQNKNTEAEQRAV